MVIKVWYPSGHSRLRIGKILDFFDEYVELQDCETNEYIIIKLETIELI